jgi:hypothetical protein
VERQENSNEEVAIHSLRACRRETAASKEATETKPDPGTIQSVEEHQEIPKEVDPLSNSGMAQEKRRQENWDPKKLWATK